MTQDAIGRLRRGLLGEFGVFKLAYAGAGASDWRAKIDEFKQTEADLRTLLTALDGDEVVTEAMIEAGRQD